MKFTYDNKKSINNKLKHGISLEEAKELWLVTSIEITARTVDEPRIMIIGKINSKFYSCIYTIREGFIRLISARRSRKVEENIYHDYFKKTEEN